MFSTLNSEQQKAVEIVSGPVLILAGAGSGKTRVLTHRMAHLISSGHVEPWRILAVTFTNKAAGEMRQRVEKLVGGPVSRDMWVATFHSACLRILRKQAFEIGYARDFTIYDDSDQLQVINLCLEELDINPKSFHPKAVAYHINQAKNNGITADQFPKAGISLFQEKISKIYPLYQQKLRTNQAMDFGDLVLNVLVLFREKPHILSYYQERFASIHVDEYQDTNRCQYELINLLAASHRNLCVVGDDDQSIYRFRGAEIRNILDFQKDYPDTTVIRLEQNYRSTGNILKAASGVVAKNLGRMGKTLWTENPAGEKIGLFQGLTEKDEAMFVVGNIKKIVGAPLAVPKDRAHQPVTVLPAPGAPVVLIRGAPLLSDIAIFYRTHAQSRPFEDELRKASIPYAIFGGMKFYERQEIKDTLAYLRLLANPSDAVSLKRIINVPTRGIGKTTVEKLEQEAARQQISVWEFLIRLKFSLHGSTLNRCSDGSPCSSQGSIIKEGHPEQGRRVEIFNSGTLAKLMNFSALVDDLKKQKEELPLLDFMAVLFEKTGYWKMLEDENSIEAASRMENLEEFVNVVEEYVKEANPPSLEGFLDQASLSTSQDAENPEGARLTLMTLHLAKGLEFPVVFMVGLEEGLFPHSRSLDTDEDIEEERRLCYVGMTRAQKKLFLSFVRERHIFGSSQYNLPSRFLEEIPEDVLEKSGSPCRGEKFFAPTDDPKTDSNGYSVDYSYDQSAEPLTLSPGRRGGQQGTYHRGAKVRHPVFGVGTIRVAEGNNDSTKLTIAFANGQIKKILSKYANLEVL